MFLPQARVRVERTSSVCRGTGASARGGLGVCEPDAFVAHIELGVPGADEHVTQNPHASQTRRLDGVHEPAYKLRLLPLGYLYNI